MTPAAPTPGTAVSGPGTLTDAIYRSSLDPARRALIDQHYAWLTNPNAVAYNPALAKQLLTAAQLSGLPIDTQIMLWGWSAATTMQIRQNDGYAYVPPNGAPNINVGPGLPPPVGELSNYPSSMPAGWIKVSTDAVDYPAYVAPADPIVAVTYSVGPFEFSQMGSDGLMHYYFGLGPNQKPPVGTRVLQDGLTFQATEVASQFMIGTGAAMLMFVLVPAATGTPAGS